jgi:D-arabinose 1-dehydrogenase-like Zn-dependent alcohol dehydrogenase
MSTAASSSTDAHAPTRSTMQALVLPAVDRPLELTSRPVPEPGAGEVRVRVEACGVCGSDLFLQAGGFGVDKLPRVPGHEAAGRVDRIGEGVRDLHEGQQVALYYIDAPLEGPWSLHGQENLDPSLTRMGVDVDGAFAEYVVRPAHTLVPVPRPIDPPTLAVLTDAVGTAYHAVVRRARIHAGDQVLVIGVGGVGSNVVQLAHRLGASVTAASRTSDKLELAQKLGAAEIVRTGRADDAERLRDMCGPVGPNVVFQCAGSAELDRLAVDVAAPGGRVVLIGASSASFEASSTDLIWRELSILGSRGFTRRDIVEVLDLYVQGAVVTEHLTQSLRPLAEANEAFEDLRSGRALRTVLIP